MSEMPTDTPAASEDDMPSAEAAQEIVPPSVVSMTDPGPISPMSPLTPLAETLAETLAGADETTAARSRTDSTAGIKSPGDRDVDVETVSPGGERIGEESLTNVAEDAATPTVSPTVMEHENAIFRDTGAGGPVLQDEECKEPEGLCPSECIGKTMHPQIVSEIEKPSVQVSVDHHVAVSFYGSQRVLTKPVVTASMAT
jgi:hypothetical protein